MSGSGHHLEKVRHIHCLVLSAWGANSFRFSVAYTATVTPLIRLLRLDPCHFVVWRQQTMRGSRETMIQFSTNKQEIVSQCGQLNAHENKWIWHGCIFILCSSQYGGQREHNIPFKVTHKLKYNITCWYVLIQWIILLLLYYCNYIINIWCHFFLKTVSVPFQLSILLVNRFISFSIQT